MKARIEGVLADAEGKLRKLLAEEAQSADVQDVTHLAGLIRQLHSMAVDGERRPGSAPTEEQGGLQQSGVADSPAAAQARPRRRSKKDEYPKFHWEDNGSTLVKTGWSKKKRKEYRHRAPKRVLDLLQKKLDTIGAKGKVFTMEDVLPLTDPDTGKDFSSYKVYMCVAYLEQQNELERSREGIRLR